MRWFWIDRFEEFVHGQRARAIKNVSMAEDYLDELSPMYPQFPCSLVVEGLAQTAGLLAGEANAFRERVVLAKLSRAKFFGSARPGDTIVYDATLDDIRSDGAIATTRARIGATTLAEVEMMFAHLDERIAGHALFFPADFLSLLRILRLYEVGKHADGRPLEIPPHMLAAERQVTEPAEW